MFKLFSGKKARTNMNIATMIEAKIPHRQISRKLSVGTHRIQRVKTALIKIGFDEVKNYTTGIEEENQNE